MEKKLTYNITVRLFSDEKSFGPGIAKLLHLSLIHISEPTRPY